MVISRHDRPASQGVGCALVNSLTNRALVQKTQEQMFCWRAEAEVVSRLGSLGGQEMAWELPTIPVAVPPLLGLHRALCPLL